MGVLDDAIKTLQDAGFSALAALNATLVVSAYTMGSVLDAQLDPYRRWTHARRRRACCMAAVDAGRYPALAGALGEVARVSTGQDRTAAFEAGLQIILAGIAAALPAQE